MGKRRSRQYTLEFKQQAAELANRIGVSKAAHQLGVPVSSIHSWSKDKNVSNKKVNPEEDINYKKAYLKLQKENDELKKANMILKKAAAFLSQDHLK